MAVPLFVLDPGDALFGPMLPLVGLADELGLVAEVSESLTGFEGEAATLLLSVVEPLLGLVAALDPMLLSEVPAVEPLLAAPWANAAGAKAATDKVRPAPNK